MAEENQEETEIDRIRNQVAKKVNECMALEQQLAGLGRQVNPINMLGLRMNLLLEMLFEDNEEARLHFELRSAEHVQRVLFEGIQQATAQVARDKLVIPNGPLPNLRRN
jgi:hypothetical protein